MNEFDREIEAALRRRADSVHSHPLGFGDVDRRIMRRRRRTASLATAAVALPALAGLGWAVTRPEPAGQTVGAPDGEFGTTTVDPATGGPILWRCEGPVPQTTTVPADPWSYFEYCEVLGVTATTVEMPMPTTTLGVIDLTSLLDQVVFVDASGGLGVAGEVTARLRLPPRYVLPATRTVEQTMAMPTGADVSAAYEISGLLGIGGFDTWTPDLIDGELPDGIAVVIVIGQDWFDYSMVSAQTTVACITGFADETTTTSVDQATGSAPPVTTTFPTTTAPC